MKGKLGAFQTKFIMLQDRCKVEVIANIQYIALLSNCIFWNFYFVLKLHFKKRLK